MTRTKTLPNSISRAITDDGSTEHELKDVWVAVAIAVSQADTARTSDVATIWADRITKDYAARFHAGIACFSLSKIEEAVEGYDR